VERCHREASAHVNGAEDAVRFVRRLVRLVDLEVVRPELWVFGFGRANDVVGIAAQSQRFRLTELGASELCAAADEMGAVALLVAQVELAGATNLSFDDALTFLALASECRALGIDLVDCVVVIDRECWSLRSLTE
jgi:hypothetical protein